MYDIVISRRLDTLLIEACLHKSYKDRAWYDKTQKENLPFLFFRRKEFKHSPKWGYKLIKHSKTTKKEAFSSFSDTTLTSFSEVKL